MQVKVGGRLEREVKAGKVRRKVCREGIRSVVIEAKRSQQSRESLMLVTHLFRPSMQTPNTQGLLRQAKPAWLLHTKRLRQSVNSRPVAADVDGQRCSANVLNVLPMLCVVAVVVGIAFVTVVVVGIFSRWFRCKSINGFVVELHSVAISNMGPMVVAPFAVSGVVVAVVVVASVVATVVVAVDVTVSNLAYLMHLLIKSRLLRAASCLNFSRSMAHLKDKRKSPSACFPLIVVNHTPRGAFD